MVNENSDLFRAHPDWALSAPDRAPTLGREQLVLDLSRQDVVDHLYGVISKLIRENGIDYIKWDYNRCMCDVYSHALPAGSQGEVFHRYILGLYQLLERLTSEFPDVLFEGCAGGGGRFDAGLLYYTPQIWCSDDTDPIERLRIQEGTSYVYPVSSIGAHVSASPNHQTGRRTPLETRGLVAMSGAFGYELDLGRLTEDEKDEIRLQVENFHRDEELIHNGLLYRLSGLKNKDNYSAWQIVSEDRSRSVVCYVAHEPRPNSWARNVKLRGLDPEALYYIEEEEMSFTGSSLMGGGYTFPHATGDYTSFQIHLRRED
jgi:alpha-galactosidase